MNKRRVVRATEELLILDELFAQYNNERKAKGVKNETLSNSEFTLYLFKRDMGINDNACIDVINKQNVVDWTNYMISETELRNESINAYLSRLRGFINWCIKNEYIEPFKVDLLKHQEEQLKYFTDEELEILIKRPDRKCDFVEYRTWLIIGFILSTGARASTVSNIKVEDVDFKNRVVTYRHLKNGKIANIPLGDSIYKMLLDYVREWNTGSDYLFCDVGGGILTAGAMRQAQVKYCKKRGVTPKGPHALRHSFARGWIRNGGGAFQLQQMLTHSDLTMTRRYVRLFSTDLEKDVMEFNPLDTIRKPSSRTKTVVRV